MELLLAHSPDRSTLTVVSRTPINPQTLIDTFTQAIKDLKIEQMAQVVDGGIWYEGDAPLPDFFRMAVDLRFNYPQSEYTMRMVSDKTATLLKSGGYKVKQAN